MRALIWVQSLLGSGHLRRALAIARALAAEGFQVAVAQGGMPSPWPAPPGVRLVQLPPIRAAGLDFALVDGDGVPVSPALWQARRQRLLALLAEVRPAVVLTELFPFGRRAFRRELAPLIAAARDARPPALVVASVRDVLVAPRDPARPREVAAFARRHYDLVLVHADPALIPFEATFPAARLLWDRLRYTGYVHDETGSPEAAPGRERRGVLVTAGGGRVARGLLEVALEAAGRDPTGEPWTLVAGPDLPTADWQRLSEAAAEGPVRLVRADPHLPRRLRTVRVAVARAGYNTVVEALAAATPLVLVPFEAGRESEQRTRAQHLAATGFARLVPERVLRPEALLAAVHELRADAPCPPRLQLDGARRTARLLREVLARREANP